MPLEELHPSDLPVHRKLTDWVASYVRDSIMGGRLRPGDRLPMSALAKSLQVSVTPIREAMTRLQEEGVVIGDAHKTFKVAPITLEDIRDYHRLHGFISGLLAQRAAGRLQPEDVAALEALDSEILLAAKAGDYARMHELNFEFHRRINGAAYGFVLFKFLSVTSRYVSRRLYPEVPGWLDGAASEHRGLLDALCAGDGERARDLMTRHVHDAGERFVADLAERGWAEADE